MPSIILNRNSDILFWNLTQFQSNANVVLGHGVRVYYVRQDGVVTGSYKIGDGITQLQFLPTFYDNRLTTGGIGIGVGNHMLTPVYGGYTDTGSGNTVLSIDVRNGVSGNFTTNYWYGGRFFKVLQPIQVYRAGVVVTSYTTGTRDINFALYRLNANYTHSLLATGNLITITGVGFHTVVFPSPVLLEPDAVYTLVMYCTGGSTGFEIGSNTRSGIVYSLSGTTPSWGTMVYWTGGANLFPNPLSANFITQPAAGFHLVYYLFTNINVI